VHEWIEDELLANADASNQTSFSAERDERRRRSSVTTGTVSER
jgi:hypothetical protein